MTDDLTLSVVAGVPVPAILIGPSERVLASNPAARAIFGEGIDGRHYATVLRQPTLLDCIEGTLRHHQPGESRYVQTGQAGETIFRVTAAPITDKSGIGVLICLLDTTDLEQAGQIRRDFVANVSHELRTPLTALLGFIETLRGAARNDAKARENFLSIMATEAMRMNRLVSDLLSLSRVEADERVRPNQRLDIVPLVHSSITALKGLAEKTGVEIVAEGDGGPLIVQADADQMTQVFHNLIENAVKYGGAGKIVTVVIRREENAPSLRVPSVCIDVRDRGEGIDPIHLPRLTERFYRVDTHRSRERGGTGLGLAIVKHIVNRHRGRFRIESEPGQGSSFAVYLPLVSTDQPA